MQVQPLEGIDHHLGGQDAHGQLVLHPQAIGHRTVRLAGHAQLVGQRLGGGVEIGEMVAPALDRAADLLAGICAAWGGRGAAAHPVIGAGKGLGPVGGGGQPFAQLVAIDGDVGEQRVGQPPPQRLGPAAGLGRGEAAGIEVIGLGQLEHQRGGDRPLVALDQVEIAGRNLQRLRHRRLGDADLEAEPPDGVPGEEFAFGHGYSCSF
ncbi:hypothetical protein S2M10_31830 [Sphingomonas sp. S2M10]|nr:hypothetical protein [Sphingomonas sp. S2M10]